MELAQSPVVSIFTLTYCYMSCKDLPQKEVVGYGLYSGWNTSVADIVL